MTKPKRSRAASGSKDDPTPRIAILDAAEAQFAERGFNGTSVREIGARADTNPGLVHYYFKSKEDLLREVIARRATELNAIRRENLLVLFANSAPGLPSLEEVLEAFIRPALEAGRDDARGGRAYTKLLFSLTAATDPLSVELISGNFDGIARMSIDSMKRVVPELTDEEAVQCYLSAIHMAFSLMAPTGRATKLAGEGDFETNADHAIDFAVKFGAAGIQAIARKTDEAVG